MEVKIISGYGENVFQMPEAGVWRVLQEAARQSKTEKLRQALAEMPADPVPTTVEPEIKVAKNDEKEPEEKKTVVKHEKPKSRTESLFGSDWKKDIKEDEKAHTTPYTQHYGGDDDDPGYRGFLLIKCDHCGKLKGFCSRQEIHASECNCGKYTELKNLRPVYLSCRCGSEYKYMTNMQTSEFTWRCLNCDNPVDLQLNSRKTAYVTIGGGQRKKF